MCFIVQQWGLNCHELYIFFSKIHLEYAASVMGGKLSQFLPEKVWQTNQKRVLTGYTIAAPHFTHLFMVLQRSLWIRGMDDTQCSQNKLALIWVCACIWIGLIRRTVCTAGDGWTARPHHLCQHWLRDTTESSLRQLCKRYEKLFCRLNLGVWPCRSIWGKVTKKQWKPNPARWNLGNLPAHGAAHAFACLWEIPREHAITAVKSKCGHLEAGL